MLIQSLTRTQRGEPEPIFLISPEKGAASLVPHETETERRIDPLFPHEAESDKKSQAGGCQLKILF